MKKETLTAAMFFVAIFVIGFITSYPRFLDGLPMGIDSPSHLFKILYPYKIYKTQGYFPRWCTDWYGGTPFLHFYPPLSYLVTFSFSLIGLGPILVYKIVNALFYIIAPITIYFLCYTLGLTKSQSRFAGLLYSLTPIILENFLYYDRFTTTISVPLLCILLICIFKALNSPKKHFYISSSILMTVIIFTHHLTAYYVYILLPFLIFFHYYKTRDRKMLLKFLGFVVIIPLLLSAIWLVPFIQANLIVNNPFYNRSNVENFISPEGLMTLIIPLGLQFLFALLEITIQMFPSKRDLSDPKKIFMLLFPSNCIIIGSIASMWFLELGQVLIILGLTVFLFSFFDRVKKKVIEKSTIIFSILWFFTFLWLGYGFYGGLFRIIPLSKSLDVLRFPFYLVIPQSILAGKFIDRLLTKRTSLKRYSQNKKLKVVSLLLIVVFSILATSYWVAKDMSYRKNATIPLEIIDYFQSTSNQGRILPIRCPHWIYVLPYYAGKPIIDGWYPQEKLLQPLLEINDYQINTLSSYKRDEQIKIWSNLIGNSSKLGLQWILIGEHDLLSLMDKFPEYTLIKKIENITVYEKNTPFSLLQIDSWEAIEKINYHYLSSDHIIINFENVKKALNISVKIANFQGWKIHVNDIAIRHSQTEEGFISFVLESGINQQVDMTYQGHSFTNIELLLLGLVLFIMLSISKSPLNYFKDII